jgi:hypothetical protein
VEHLEGALFVNNRLDRKGLPETNTQAWFASLSLVAVENKSQHLTDLLGEFIIFKQGQTQPF